MGGLRELASEAGDWCDTGGGLLAGTYLEAEGMTP